MPFLEKELFLLPRLVSPGGVCLDVGAAGGAHAVVLARQVGTQGQVHAFEPRLGSARLLGWLARMLGLGQLMVHQVALGARVGTAVLTIPLTRTRAHLGTGQGRQVTVPTTTLDRFASGRGLTRVDLIRCDAEGAEPAILRGGAMTIARFRPVIVCEVEQRHLSRHGAAVEQVEGFLRRFGYRPHRFDGALRPVSGIDAEDNDYVFLPSG